MFLKDETGPISQEKYREIQDYIRDEAVRTVQSVNRYPVDFVAGSSGTIENLADIAAWMFHERKRTPDDILTARQLKKVIKELRMLPVDERRKIQGINPERADIIIAGAAVLDTLVEEFGLEHIRVSDRGLQDGVLVDHLEKFSQDDTVEASFRESSVLRLGRSLNFDETHARNVARLALDLFDSARQAGLHRFGEWERELLEYAAILHDIGIALSYTDHQAHSYYFIRHAGLLGFDQTEIEIMANTALFHRKAYPKKKFPEFAALDERSQEIVRYLCVLLSIAESLDRTHLGLIEHAHLERENEKSAVLVLISSSKIPLELWGVEFHKKEFEKVFDLDLHVRAESPAQKAVEGQDSTTAKAE
jgi:exopolyphosphatase/guanosine-5'-triphosphate,3'-diphosphate pyrophosphatase